MTRTAIVTGAGRGIGKSIAIGLAKAGWHVVLVARNRVELDVVRSEIVERGGAATSMPADVASAADVRNLAERTSELGIGALINAAGVFGPMGPIVETDVQGWDRTVEVNLLGTVHMVRAFAPGMVAAGWGRILNVSSAAALHAPGPFNSAYATSKVAVNQFTRHLAVELQGTGVTANVFHPGDVRTEMFEDIRRQTAEASGPEPDTNYGRWVQWMDETGGDPPDKAVALVLRVLSDPAYKPNGEFLWIDDPLQTPVASWPADPESPPDWSD